MIECLETFLVTVSKVAGLNQVLATGLEKLSIPP